MYISDSLYKYVTILNHGRFCMSVCVCMCMNLIKYYNLKLVTILNKYLET